MRFDFSLPGVACVLMSVLLGSCKDLVAPGPIGGELEPGFSRVAIRQVIGGDVLYYLEPAEIVIYDEGHPLESGGLAAARFDFPKFAEFEGIPSGVYSIALINTLNNTASGILPNLLFHGVELPGEVSLTAEIQPLPGRVILPTGLVIESDAQNVVRLAWESIDPRSGSSYSLVYQTSADAAGVFSARLLPGSYYPNYIQWTARSALRFVFEEPLEVSAANSIDVELPLRAIDIGFDRPHPGFPAQAELRLDVKIALAHRFSPTDWLELGAYEEFPLTVWLAERVYQLELRSTTGMFFPRISWWDASANVPPSLNHPSHRVHIEVIDEASSPLEDMAVKFGRGGESISPRTGSDGAAAVFLDPGSYSLEIDGLSPEVVVVNGELELIRVVPAGRP
jgi:hypothetical protein